MRSIIPITIVALLGTAFFVNKAISSGHSWIAGILMIAAIFIIVSGISAIWYGRKR